MTNGLEKFTDLESKVYRIVELFRATNVQKEALEKEVLRFQSKIDRISAENGQLKSEVSQFKKENRIIKEKVETIIRKLDRLRLWFV